jgi:predicted transposase/invertase (TIGR01784 family)
VFDNLSKFLAKEYSQDFASWLIGEPVKLTELKPTELSLEPIRADSVILLKSSQVIVHCEFQTDPDPTMGFRMADYALRIYRQFPDRPLVQVVVYLRETSSEAAQITTFQGNNFSHEFRVIRLWEQPTAPFLERSGLLPYAALTQTNDRASVLREVARKIDAISDRQQQSNLSMISAVMGGLSLEQHVVQQILRRDAVQESSVYQAWKAENEQQGREKERQEIALKLLQQKVAPEAIAQATGLTIEQLQQLQTSQQQS